MGTWHISNRLPHEQPPSCGVYCLHVMLHAMLEEGNVQRVDAPVTVPWQMLKSHLPIGVHKSKIS